MEFSVTIVQLCLVLMPLCLKSVLGEEIPKITFMRRQVRNFVPGQRSIITVVYRSNVDAKARWFRKARDGTLPYAEIPDMLQTEGDTRYQQSFMSSGTVRAATLVIRRVDERHFPAKFTLVLSVDESSIQYQLDVKILIDTPYKRDVLVGVRWLTLPPPTISFGYNGAFSVGCSAEMEEEDRVFLDELQLYRISIKRKRRRDRVGLTNSESCGIVHRQRNDYHEVTGKYTSVGKRIPLKYGSVKYDVTHGVKNATREDEGMYACFLGRKEDRTYVSSWARQGNLAMHPMVELLPCEAHRFNERESRLHLSSGTETCFRCRGYGYPPPEVEVLRGSSPLLPQDGILVDNHKNVPGGGLSEVTYTILNPSASTHSGQYHCMARNAKGTAPFKFHISIFHN